MGLADDLRSYAAKTHKNKWERRDGQKVPEADDLALKNDAVNLDAVVLYADLDDSTGLVQGWKDWFAAEVYKNYLYVAARIIRDMGGVITAYDGDRAMAVYIGGSKNSNAAKTALRINWAVANVLQPAIKDQYPDNTYVLKQKVGIASSKVMVARTGVRGSNDLVWVGNSANIAAKLSSLDSTYPSLITEAVYKRLDGESKLGGNPKREMWTDLGVKRGLGRIYGSKWTWSF